VLMNDLVQMLSDQNIGVNISAREQIPCSVIIWSSIRLSFLNAPCDSPSILLDSRWLTAVLSMVFENILCTLEDNVIPL
jgi:hypothetical protein